MSSDTTKELVARAMRDAVPAKYRVQSVGCWDEATQEHLDALETALLEVLYVSEVGTPLRKPVLEASYAIATLRRELAVAEEELAVLRPIARAAVAYVSQKDRAAFEVARKRLYGRIAVLTPEQRARIEGEK